MKIYGQTFSEIFQNLNTSQKIIIGAGCVFVLFTLIYVPYSFITLGQQKVTPGPVTLQNLPSDVMGTIDPSVTASDDAAVMVFTALKPGKTNDVDFGTEIQLATSDSACERFASTGPIFETRNEELMGPDGLTPVTTGIWRTETPTIIHDPADKGREWKVYAYKYFWAKNIPLARMYSLIALKTASSPTGPWSQEEWVFSTNKNNPPYPYASMIKTSLDTLDPSLRNVSFYSRPSALQVNNVILMTLSTYMQGSNLPDRVIMLASSDHGHSWKYLGTPLTAAMAPSIGPYTKFQGASLIEDKSAIYLAAVFGDKDNEGLGTVLLPFDDVIKATLKKDEKTGKPVVLKTIPRLSLVPTTVGGGFAAYNDACKSGIITSEQSGFTGRYEIFKTYQTPTSKK